MGTVVAVGADGGHLNVASGTLLPSVALLSQGDPKASTTSCRLLALGMSPTRQLVEYVVANRQHADVVVVAPHEQLRSGRAERPYLERRCQGDNRLLGAEASRIPHTMWNAGLEPARIIELYTPGGFELFFKDFEERLRQGPTGLDELNRIGEPHGILFF